MNNFWMRPNFLQMIGFLCSILSAACGRVAIFTAGVLYSVMKPPFHLRAFLRQMVEIGYYSLPVVGLTALFTGAVLALQSYTGFARINASSAVASVVALSITRELGPVFAGLMLAGRISAAIAAEIGTMRVTEQIDALYTLSTDPMKYLVVPRRVLAGVLMLPILVLVADIIGVFGGYLIAAYKLGFSPEMYLINTVNILEFSDIFSGVIKACVFVFIVSLIGCFCGYFSKVGAQGVGSATTSAVVLSSIMILLANYIITGLLF